MQASIGGKDWCFFFCYEKGVDTLKESIGFWIREIFRHYLISRDKSQRCHWSLLALFASN